MECSYGLIACKCTVKYGNYVLIPKKSMPQLKKYLAALTYFCSPFTYSTTTARISFAVSLSLGLYTDNTSL